MAKYSQIEDITGKKFEAIKIFTMAISYLKTQLVDRLKISEHSDITERDIRWVITVPAIWSEAAKQYMREAADVVSSILVF